MQAITAMNLRRFIVGSGLVPLDASTTDAEDFKIRTGTSGNGATARGPVEISLSLREKSAILTAM